MSNNTQLIDKLAKEHNLSVEEYESLLLTYTDEDKSYAAELALAAKKQIYGDTVFLRGLIEISSYCKNDCLYCGLRRSNKDCLRYRLDKETILACCKEGYFLGYRTFVLQGGEDNHFTDEVMVDIVSSIKSLYPDCAVTLSLGERSYQSYKALRLAGADRYLLRHETASKEHYQRLHPQSMEYENRIRCLNDLKSLGFQTGCGFMVGSPYQTMHELAMDLKLVEEFSPQMCGIGPFIPHHATPFKDMSAGSVELTCFLLSLVRLIKPSILLPATTALGTLHPQGR
ncbi:MAG: [FeFe] hydrogenase H-cluster radical SAM maturase HydE, partial [Clostridia bacterium]|nr:[FeFe] hydrogenase H-cluster radical SAM maturase HydE [Clostridia bacterium]